MGKYPRTLNLVRPNTANTRHSYRLVPSEGSCSSGKSCPRRSLWQPPRGRSRPLEPYRLRKHRKEGIWNI